MSKTLNELTADLERRNLIDRRAYRTQIIVANIMQIVGKHLRGFHVFDRTERGIMRNVEQDLTELLRSHGAEIISDADRAAFGLPPRGPDGWTQEEIVALEQRRLEVMSQPPAMVVPKGSMT